MATHPGDVAVPVPYISKLGQHLEPGQTLVIHGKIKPEITRFEINLLSGAPEINPGIAALHISFRFDEKKVVFNSFESEKWGKEERVSNPFRPEEDFDIRVRVHEDKFEISANQKEIRMFKFRVPLSSIDYLAIRGDILLKGVHWGGRYYDLPFETIFTGGHLRSGQRVYVYGVPKGGKFNVDFVGRNGDTLFHFNPRFSEKKIVRNASIGGSWGSEEREGPFPFKKGVGFDLVIVNEPYSLQLFVDGDRVGTFAHRTGDPAQDYHGFRIAGEIEVTGIEFDNHY